MSVVVIEAINGNHCASRGALTDSCGSTRAERIDQRPPLAGRTSTVSVESDGGDTPVTSTLWV